MSMTEIIKHFLRYCAVILLFNKNLNLFLVFFASYYFVSQTKILFHFEAKTSNTNPFFRYFALLIFASFSLRFASKRNLGTPYLWVIFKTTAFLAYQLCIVPIGTHSINESSPPSCYRFQLSVFFLLYLREFLQKNNFEYGVGKLMESRI